jgi:hypothetical protein
VVASVIASRSGARARPELPGVGGARGPNSSAWGQIRVRGFGRKRERGGVFIGGCNLGEGLGFEGVREIGRRRRLP